jgi:hypothetical protein
MPNRLKSALGRVLNAQLAAWLLLAFAAAYLFFFIWPVFLTPGAFKFFRYLPAMDPIGADLSEILSISSRWVPTGAYPPLTLPLFALLLPLDASRAYKLVTLLSIAAYAVMTLVLPLNMRTSKRIPAAFTLIVVTGLLSYGFQFELERGQFNVLAVMPAFVAVWIYHYRSGYRLLAYLLLSLAAQLKLYPFIFAIMLIDDWRAWRDNLRRLSFLGLANVALFLVLGPTFFQDFLGRVGSSSANPPVWIYNHSISAFARLGVPRLVERGWTWLSVSEGLVEVALYVTLLLCLAAIIVRAIRSGQTGLDPHLLLACTIAALVVPPLSNDYKLSVLAAPVAILILRPGEATQTEGVGGRKLIGVVSMVLLAAAYVSTLFASNYKPHTLWLENNFPALLAMLIAVTALSLSSPVASAGESAPAPNGADRA